MNRSFPMSLNSTDSCIRDPATFFRTTQRKCQPANCISSSKKGFGTPVWPPSAGLEMVMNTPGRWSHTFGTYRS